MVTIKNSSKSNLFFKENFKSEKKIKKKNSIHNF